MAAGRSCVDTSDAWTFAGLIGLGAGAGVLSTLFGIGGGILIVPGLVYVGHVGFGPATAISLMAMMAHPPVGVYQHARRGAVDWPLAIRLAAGGAVGVAAGILVIPHVPVPWLKLLFGLVLLGAAWRLVARLPATQPAPPGPLFVAALGGFAGFISRLLGVGGGLVTVPVMALGGTPMHTAVGSSLVPVFTNAVLASAVSLQGGAPWQPAIPIALGALGSVTLGTWAAHGLDARPLARLFAAALTVVALYIGGTSHAFW